MKLLVAEDDTSVCEMLQLFFQKERYDTTFVHDGLTAQQRIDGEPWDFIILDWMLPGKDGVSLCKDLRQTRETPVILLTARDREQDRIQGLELGADDYVTKPFSPMELIARMKAVLRRYRIGTSSEARETAAAVEESDRFSVLKHKSITIQLESRTAVIQGQEITNLTPKEFELLCLFVRYPKKVFTREQLLESIWGYDYIGEERTVDVHIKRLRNKISTQECPLIVTVWGVGYKLEE
ncbi:response regulator transcription factor [Paenibacillus doosanensis]|uniref:Transcriptional regulatory protein SrrA n=1 Tax=Paenibacillus konkukensis TaxID=2020716 RepID=A0ABY4RNE9_9BACL|nr:MULTISPECIES: response regulator transcription factor [Paenibacillus]MCS7461757.1 response regulator transcription factor [Paenibacillus doosanensis]UQZ83597.1 Transcriptional regulatory protein SrrA [Paenibacillus konkukensis]